MRLIQWFECRAAAGGSLLFEGCAEEAERFFGRACLVEQSDKLRADDGAGSVRHG